MIKKLTTWIRGFWHVELAPDKLVHIKRVPAGQRAALKRKTVRITGKKAWVAAMKAERLDALAKLLNTGGAVIVAYGDIEERAIPGTAFHAITRDYYHL